MLSLLSGAQSLVATNRLHVVFGAASVPHPEKAAKGGEDAFLYDDERSMFGVADGVGGSARNGVDPGLFSREILERCHDAATCGLAGDPLPDVLKLASEHPLSLPGSSTLVLGKLEASTNMLRILNLGDSGAMVLRPSMREFSENDNRFWPRVVLRTQDQVHGWNWPYQAKAKDFNEVPTKVDDLAVVVQEGDVIIAASDGVLDNLFDHAVQDLVAEQLPALFEGSPMACQAAVDALAQSIAQQASAVGLKRGADAAGVKTPFMANAAEEGRQHVGGKLDDVAVVCGLVQSGERPPQRIGHNFKAVTSGDVSGMVAPMAAPVGAAPSLQSQVASAVASAPAPVPAAQAPAPSEAPAAADNFPRTPQMAPIEELVKAAEERMKKAQQQMGGGPPPVGAQMPGPPGGPMGGGPPGGQPMGGGPPGGPMAGGPPGGPMGGGPPGGPMGGGPPGGPMVGPGGQPQLPPQQGGPPQQMRPLPLPDASAAAFAAAEEKFQRQMSGHPHPGAPGQPGLPGPQPPPMQQMAGPGGPHGMPQPMPGVPAGPGGPHGMPQPMPGVPGQPQQMGGGPPPAGAQMPGPPGGPMGGGPPGGQPMGGGPPGGPMGGPMMPMPLQVPDLALSQSAQALAQAAEALAQAQVAQQQLAQQSGRPGQPSVRPGQHKPVEQPISAAQRAAARDKRLESQKRADFGRG